MKKRIGLTALLLTSLAFLTSCTNLSGLADFGFATWLLAIVIIAFAWWYTFKKK